MDPTGIDEGMESDTLIGVEISTPTRNNNNNNNNNSNINENITPADPTSNYAPFGPTWSAPSTPSVPSGISIPVDSIFKNMSSPARSITRPRDSLTYRLRMDEENEDALHIEKSRILEHLRHATAVVDELESRLQAVRRRRARAVVDALESHQKAQESEAKEMRNVLGSIHQLSISEAEREAGSTSEENKSKAAVPVKTLLNTLTTQGQSGINLAMVQRLQNFTDFVFTSIENYIISTPEGENGKRRYKIAGSCYRLDFEVNFIVHEPSLNLTDLKITLPHSVRQELGRFVSNAEEHAMLLPFFRTFLKYAQMDYDRKTLMNNLAQRFPRLLKANHAFFKLSKSKVRSLSTSFDKADASSRWVLPGGPGVQTLTFSGTSKSSPELVLQWTIETTEQGRIIPHVRLLPRMHKKWRQADEKGTLDAIPTQFARLIQLKGTENAIAILLQCVFGRKATEGGGGTRP
ncbi:hypothetical protein BG015_002068 [Linnemannia schmuckeri]|uniref:Uncharacterized protein n=1 Tax=Linnemannia schmuckeri TaxID=64567 RepID=A0A9P5V6I3_9FUNG|nr:hypothetical protein BG015_002068 [Linnemannia schmuckeri]